MLKEEKKLREWCGDPSWPENRKLYSSLITALRRAVQEDICQQVADAIQSFPKNIQAELLDTIMRYEKPKKKALIRGEGRGRA